VLVEAEDVVLDSSSVDLAELGLLPVKVNMVLQEITKEPLSFAERGGLGDAGSEELLRWVRALEGN
jgi:hypothetical protein